MAEIEHPIPIGEWVEYRTRQGVRVAQVMCFAEANDQVFYDISATGRWDFLDWESIAFDDVIGVAEPCGPDPVEWLLARI